VQRVAHLGSVAGDIGDVPLLLVDQVLAVRRHRLRDRAFDLADDLSSAGEILLLVARPIATEAEVLLFDEQSIGLAPLPVERVMNSIREINRTLGTTILLVEQNLKHGLAIAARAVVLNRGSKLFDGDPAALSDERKLMELF
jgi:branched-chain amino acid transport system ATP-binding protein